MKTNKRIRKILIVIMSLIAMMTVAFTIIGCGEVKVVGIEVDTTEFNTQIEQNTTIDFEQVKVYKKLSDGSKIEINDDIEFSEIDTSVVGKREVQVTYGAYSSSFTIEIIKTIREISVDGNSIQNTVDHNGTLDVSNARLKITYSDNTTEVVSEGFTISAPDTSTVGSKKLNITYKGKTFEFNYQVEKTVVSIEISGSYATKVAYGKVYDKSGITVNAVYSNGSTGTVANNLLTISDVETTTVGEKTLFVTYKGKTATLSINVYAELQSIEYKSGLVDRLKYNTTLDDDDLTLTLTYTDGTTKEVTNNNNITVTGLNNLTLGEQIVVITYNNKTCEKAIEVYEEIESLTVEAKDATDSATFYCLKDGVVDTTKFTVKVRYTKNTVTLDGDNESVEYDAIDTTTIGEKTLTVKYVVNQEEKATTTVKIKVVESWEDVEDLEISSISIVNSSVASYVNHNETLDLSELQILVNYSNGSSATLDYSEHKTADENQIIATFSSSTCGEQTLQVTYKTFNATKTITVKRVLQSIAITKDTEVSSVKYGNELDISNVEVKATYSNGDVEVVNNPSSNIDDFSNTTLGNQNIVFTFQTKTVTMVVNVYEEVESIEYVSGASLKVEYQGTYSVSNIKIKEKYTSGRYGDDITNTNGTLFTVTGVDTSKLGNYTLTITYNGFSCELSSKVEVYDPITKVEYKSGLPTSVDVGTNFANAINGKVITLTVTYKTGATKDITTGYTIGTLSTTLDGMKTLEITYEGETAKTDILVSRTYEITGFSNPQFVTAYNSNSQMQNTFNATGSSGIKGFTELNNMFVVGNENNFVFTPILTTDDTETLTSYLTKVQVFIKNNDTFTLLEENNDYVSVISYREHTIKFTSNAVGKIFKVSVLPYEKKTGEDFSAKELIFKVVEAYNVYNAHDFSMLDNFNFANKWAELKSADEIALSNNIHGIVLMNDISIELKDIPSYNVFNDNQRCIDLINGSNFTIDDVKGTIIDSGGTEEGAIFYRKVANNDTFNIEGNYFKLSGQNLPLMKAETGSPFNYIEDGALTVHTTLIRLNGSGDNSNINFNNTNIFGNSQKDESAQKSGGLIFLKSATANLTIYNCLSQCWFINFLLEVDSTVGGNNIMKISKSNAYDAYNTLLYVWGINDMRIEDSILIGAGGPVMICDHAYNDDATGAGGFPTFVTTKNSIFESYIAGTEGWFNTYAGSGALVSSIKTMNQLITPYGNTLCDTTGQKINLIAVYKSGEAEGLTTSVIRGSFTDTTLNAQSQAKFTSGLNFDTSITQIKTNMYTTLMGIYQNQATVEGLLGQTAILQTFNGTYGVPGTAGWFTGLEPDQVKFATAEKYLTVYLFNGMAALLGLNKLPA